MLFFGTRSVNNGESPELGTCGIFSFIGHHLVYRLSNSRKKPTGAQHWKYTLITRAGHFRYFWIFFIIKMVFCIFYQAYLTGSGLFKMVQKYVINLIKKPKIFFLVNKLKNTQSAQLCSLPLGQPLCWAECRCRWQFWSGFCTTSEAHGSAQSAAFKKKVC